MYSSRRSVCRAIDYEKLPQSFHTGEYDLLAGVHNFWIASGRRLTGCAWSSSPIGAQPLQGTSSSPSSISTPTSAITANALLPAKPRRAHHTSVFRRRSGTTIIRLPDKRGTPFVIFPHTLLAPENVLSQKRR